MRRAGLLVLPLVLVALSATQNSRAQDEPSDVIMLPCDGKCATITRPLLHISGDALPGIGYDAGGSVNRPRFAEGFVEVQYTILPNGHVADDISVVQVMGPPEFVEATKRAVRTWVYQPAMVDGQPVAVSHQLMARFGVSGGATGARSHVVAAYRDAAELMKTGKLDEAHAILAEMLNRPDLSFFERGIIMYPLVLIAMQRQQYAEASRLSQLALYFGPDNFMDATYRGMYRSNISSLLDMGNIVGAAKALGEYKKWKHFDPADPLINQIAEAQKKLDALPSFGLDARIPDAADADGYGMFLYRRYFTFTKINGKLDRLTIDCHERQVQSPISDQAEWTVPKNWSDCAIFVRGTPGTTFQIVQFSAPKSDSH